MGAGGGHDSLLGGHGLGRGVPRPHPSPRKGQNRCPLPTSRAAGACLPPRRAWGWGALRPPGYVPPDRLPTFQNLNENVERAGNTPCSGGCRGVGNPPAGRGVWGEGGSPSTKRGPGVSPGGSPGGKAPWSGGPGGEAHPGTRPCHRPLGTTQKVPEPDHKK